MRAFVIMRDRVSYAEQCVAALLAADLDVIVIDHGSTYPPAVAWLEAIEALGSAGFNSSSVRVDRLPNAHPRDLWENGTLAKHLLPGERFIVTDCDVIPDPTCPPDWPTILGEQLDAHPWASKAGLALRFDDLPDHYVQANAVRSWEARWYSPWCPVITERGVLTSRRPVRAWRSHLDTTLAMYPRLERFRTDAAVRVGGEYVARHLPWYERSGDVGEEQRWYAEHAERAISHWLDPELFLKEGRA